VIAKASMKYLRTSPQKTRLVVDQIRGKGVEEALRVLQFSPKAVARDVEKLLKSAVANAEQREERVDVDDLWIEKATVDTGPTQKRVRFRAMGRVFRILKRSSHVTLELDLRPQARQRAGAAAPAPRSRAGRAAGAPKAASSKSVAKPRKKSAKEKKPAE
jgi:large subunit ribosomal protein L22